MKKLKYIIPLIIFILGSNVYAATNVTMSNSQYSYSPVTYSNLNYYYGPYIANLSINTAQSTSTSNNNRYAGRSRTYAYFTSANALRTGRQYQAKMRVCGGSTAWSEYVGEAIPAKLHWAYNTTNSMTGAINGNLNDLTMTYSLEDENSGGCVNFTFTFNPPIDNIRAIGFWITYSRLSPVSTCWEADCSNETHTSADLVDTTLANGTGNGSFNIKSFTISYTESGTGTATIEANQQTIIDQQQQIKNEVKGLPAKIWNVFKEGLKELFIPTEEQMNDLFNEVETNITAKLGILGLPINIYINTMRLVNSVDSEENWCFSWNNVSVPNFENHNIIQAGSWCFDTLEDNQTMATLRATSHGITGALLLLSFLAFLNNKKNKILEIPDRDEYVYFTEEDVFTYNRETGETDGMAQHRSRTTRREKK